MDGSVKIKIEPSIKEILLLERLIDALPEIMKDKDITLWFHGYDIETARGLLKKIERDYMKGGENNG